MKERNSFVKSNEEGLERVKKSAEENREDETVKKFAYFMESTSVRE